VALAAGILGAVRPGVAQIETVQQRVPDSVIVLPCVDASKIDQSQLTDLEAYTGIAGDVASAQQMGLTPLGAMMSAALASELGNNRIYEVIPPARVLDAMRQLSLNVAMDGISLLRLLESLDARFALLSTIKTAQVVTTRDGNEYFEIGLSVRLFSRAMEAAQSGAEVVGRGSPRPSGFGLDVLAQAAANDTAFRARRQWEAYKQPRGSVLSSTPSDVVVNAGADNGVRPDQSFAVTRGSQRVGTIKAYLVRKRDTFCKIIDAPGGIWVQDQARAIWEPDVAQVAEVGERRSPVVTSTAGRRSSMNSTLGIVALAALVSFFGQGGAFVGPPPGQAGGFQAHAISNFNGGSDLSTIVPNPAIELRWNPRGVEDGTLAWIIERDGFLVQILVNGFDATDHFVDYAGQVCLDDDGFLVATCTEVNVDPDSAAFTWVSPTLCQDDCASSGGGGGAGLPRNPRTPVTPAAANFTPTPAATLSCISGLGVIYLSGNFPAAGVGHIYRLRQIVSDRVTCGRNPDGTLDVQWAVFEQFEGPQAGPVTPILPPQIVSPIPDAEVNTNEGLLFEWDAPDAGGADEYAVQVASNASFSDAVTFNSLLAVQNPAFFDPPGIFPTQSFSRVSWSVKLNLAFAGFPPGSTQPVVYFWRVGARSSIDRVTPQSTVPNFPQPLVGTSPNDNWNGYVWSPAQAVQAFTGDIPPPPSVTVPLLTDPRRNGSRQPVTILLPQLSGPTSPRASLRLLWNWNGRNAPVGGSAPAPRPKSTGGN